MFNKKIIAVVGFILLFHNRFSLNMIQLLFMVRAWITNSFGQTVYSVAITQGLHPIDLREKPDGVYFVKAINNNRQINYRIIISK